jgi:hypothetical protein
LHRRDDDMPGVGGRNQYAEATGVFLEPDGQWFLVGAVLHDPP